MRGGSPAEAGAAGSWYRLKPTPCLLSLRPIAKRARDSPVSCRFRCLLGPARGADCRACHAGRRLARRRAHRPAALRAFQSLHRSADRAAQSRHQAAIALAAGQGARARPPIRAVWRIAIFRRALAWRYAGLAPAPMASASAPGFAMCSTRLRVRASPRFRRCQSARQLPVAETLAHVHRLSALRAPRLLPTRAVSARRSEPDGRRRKAPAGRARTGPDSPAGSRPAVH